jgi:hypothetical protein
MKTHIYCLNNVFQMGKCDHISHNFYYEKENIKYVKFI